jgi:uncharacterized membrane protein
VQTVTWLIELGVGLACLAIGVTALRSERLRLVGAIATIAGLAAVVHAGIQLSD